MITLRRTNERHHQRRSKREVWLTFDRRNRADPYADGFGSLEMLAEDRLPPRAAVPRPSRQDAEIVTYVREGALAYQDSLGRSGVIRAGEFQRMTGGRGIRHSETNESPTDWAQVFRIGLRSSANGLEKDHEQRRFSAAERRGALCVVASPDARRGSLRLQQDAFLYSAMLHPGHHIVHELAHTRSAWLHLVTGELTLADVVLTSGDGAGIAAERSVSLTAREESEILLLDLGPEPPASAGNEGNR